MRIYHILYNKIVDCANVFIGYIVGRDKQFE